MQDSLGFFKCCEVDVTIYAFEWRSGFKEGLVARAMLSRRNIFRFLNGNKEKPPGICEVLGGKIHNPGYCEREGNYGPYWSTSLSHSSLQRVVEDVHPLASQVASMGEQLVYKPHQLLIRHDEPYREWCFNVLTALIQQADNVLDTGNGKTQDA